jgi:hypothetical protein
LIVIADFPARKWYRTRIVSGVGVLGLVVPSLLGLARPEAGEQVREAGALASALFG